MSTNNNGSPYLGSKISLVSKAKIRYEGILYTIDANESTVALAKVRSYGTEDRPTERPVPAREEVFEYIIFRGADIEDLQVCEPPQSAVTQDPAIVRSSEPTPYPRSGNSSGLPVSSQQNVPSSSNALQNALVTATTGAAISPTLPQSKSIDRSNTTPNNMGNRQMYYSNNTRYNNNQQYNNRQRPMDGIGGGSDSYGDMNEGGYSGYDNGYNNYDMNGYGMNGGMGGRQGYNRYQQRGSTGNQQQRPMRQQSQPQQRERANSTRERANSTRGSRTALKFTGDFDFEKANAEFDKNAITEELKKSLSIKSTSTSANSKKDTSDTATTKLTPTSNSTTNEQTTTTKPQSPTTTSSENDNTNSTKQSQSQQQQDGIDQSGFYDKTKSFFDRISCEATEKDKTNARRNWAEERKINAETFGLSYRPQTAVGGYQQQQRGFYRGRGSNMYNNNNRQMYYNNSMRYNNQNYNNRQRPMGGNGGYDGYEMNGGGGGGYNNYRNYGMNGNGGMGGRQMQGGYGYQRGGMRTGRGIRAQS